jgi:hypothetical protein
MLCFYSVLLYLVGEARFYIEVSSPRAQIFWSVTYKGCCPVKRFWHVNLLYLSKFYVSTDYLNKSYTKSYIKSYTKFKSYTKLNAVLLFRFTISHKYFKMDLNFFVLVYARIKTPNLKAAPLLILQQYFKAMLHGQQFFLQLAMQFYSWEILNYQIRVFITLRWRFLNISKILHRFH